MPENMTGPVSPEPPIATPQGPAPAAGWPPLGEVTKDERTMAMLALIFAGFTFIVPLIIFLVKKDESKFVAFHSLQGLFFSLVMIGATVISCGLLWPVGIVVGILWGLKANSGEWAELPVVGKWARKQ